MIYRMRLNVDWKMPCVYKSNFQPLSINFILSSIFSYLLVIDLLRSSILGCPLIARDQGGNIDVEYPKVEERMMQEQALEAFLCWYQLHVYRERLNAYVTCTSLLISCFNVSIHSGKVLVINDMIIWFLKYSPFGPS